MRHTGSMYFPIQPVRCTKHKSQNTNHKKNLSNMICNWSLIHRKFKSVPYPIAAKSCVSGVKSCIRNSQIPYLKANSIFKISFVNNFHKNNTKHYDKHKTNRYNIKVTQRKHYMAKH